jgi:hypothetical protein
MKLSISLYLAALVPATNAFSVTNTARQIGFNTKKNSSFNKFHPLFSSEVESSEEAIDIDVPSEVEDATNTEIIPESPEEQPEPESDSDSEEAESTIMSSEEKNKLLQKMLILSSSTDRGQFASSTQKESMQQMITQLEATSPITGPTNSPDIEGTWELLYSSTQLFRSSPFFMAGRAVCQDGEEAERYDWFCDMHRAALAISEIGKVRQIISSTRMVSEFEVNVGSVPFLSDFTPLKYSGGLPFTINGAIVSSADITPARDGEAWEIFVDQVEIKGSNVPFLKSILEDDRVALKSRDLGSFLEENVDGYSNPRPIFETTYLDDDIRISKDQDGKIFVYGKMSDSTEPTEYKGDGDLGLIGLLEGLNDNFFKFSI